MTTSGGGLPLWVRVSILGALLGLLIFNVVTKGDSALSLLIAGGLVGAIGLDQNSRNREG